MNSTNKVWVINNDGNVFVFRTIGQNMEEYVKAEMPRHLSNEEKELVWQEIVLWLENEEGYSASFDDESVFDEYFDIVYTDLED